MRFLLGWLAPVLARRIYKAHPAWWPVGWIASRWGLPVALGVLAWTASRLNNRLDNFLDARIDEHRARREAATEDAGTHAR